MENDMGYKKQSTMDDVFEICAILPWWFGASAAVFSYFIFHHYAVTEVVNDGSMGEFAVASLKQSVSYYMQYIFPAFSSAGALVSYFKRKKSNYDN
jgi:restriction system protein